MVFIAHLFRPRPVPVPTVEESGIVATSLWGEGARPLNEEICLEPPLLNSCGDSQNLILKLGP